jgi:hypothetical protein
MANDFFEAYKHPMWQEKRLRIMERDGFKCTTCDSKDKTLNVHHGYYEKNKKPWEYANETLHTLCEPCHERAEAVMKAIKGLMACLGPKYLDSFVGYLGGIGLWVGKAEKLHVGNDRDIANGICDSWGLPVNFIFELLDESGVIHAKDLRQRHTEYMTWLAEYQQKQDSSNPSAEFEPGILSSVS